MAKRKLQDREAERAAAAGTPSYSKRQFVESRRYSRHKDLLNALLQDGKTYSTGEVDQMLNQFLNREVC